MASLNRNKVTVVGCFEALPIDGDNGNKVAVANFDFL